MIPYRRSKKNRGEMQTYSFRATDSTSYCASTSTLRFCSSVNRFSFRIEWMILTWWDHQIASRPRWRDKNDIEAGPVSFSSALEQPAARVDAQAPRPGRSVLFQRLRTRIAS